MNRPLSAVFALLFLVAPHLATADVLEIPLALTGPNDPYSIEITDFLIGIPLVAVSQVSLRLEGSYHEITYQNVFDPFSFLSRPGYLDMYIGDDVVVDAFVEARHQFPAGSGLFDFEEILLTGDSADWTFLLDGAAQIGLGYGPSYTYDDDGQYYSAVGTFGQLSSARLMVTYDPSAPTEDWSWGAIKHLFR